MTAQRLFLADLEAHDPESTQGTERRFLCPFCGGNKPRDAAHRSMNVNAQTGAYFCQRCEQRGKLADFWEERPKRNQRELARERLRRLTILPPAPSADARTVCASKIEELRTSFEALPPLPNSWGAAYLRGRSVPVEIAVLAGTRYAPNWLGRPAVAFPIGDRLGALVAVQGRYTDGGDTPKTRTQGPKSRGVFRAPTVDGFSPFDAKTPTLIITEAPLDALSIAAAGFPALALCGKTGPDWLPAACFNRRVALAFDADDPGDEAAHCLALTLQSFGATCQRLRPQGAKDWNEFLCLNAQNSLCDFLANELL